VVMGSVGGGIIDERIGSLDLLDQGLFLAGMNSSLPVSVLEFDSFSRFRFDPDLIRLDIVQRSVHQALVVLKGGSIIVITTILVRSDWALANANPISTYAEAGLSHSFVSLVVMVNGVKIISLSVEGLLLLSPLIYRAPVLNKLLRLRSRLVKPDNLIPLPTPSSNFLEVALIYLGLIN
jgi:hypothetical protein